MVLINSQHLSNKTSVWWLSHCRTERNMASERTFIMIKPDGVQRGLVGEIISRFEKKGFKLVAMKVMQASVEHLEKHYADLSSKGFFRGLVTYMASGPVCAMVRRSLVGTLLTF